MSQEAPLAVTVFPSTARTATPTAATFTDGNHPREGGHIVINVSALTGTPSVVFNVEGLAPVANVWYPILISAAIIATGTTILRIYPGAAATANLSVSDFLPPTWRVRPVHGTADSITYSVEAFLR